MNKHVFIVVFVTVVFSVPLAFGQITSGPGNPTPGYPHDTIMIHVMKADSGPKQCDGGHSLFLRQQNGVVLPADIRITMVDWNQVDNDGNGLMDDDPILDPVEPGAETKAIDCDAWGDGLVSLQIRDTDPRPGYVSTQEWFIRLVGKPGQNFAFTSYASQTVSCTTDAGADGIPGTADDVTTCVYGDTVADWVELASFNLATAGCVKQVKAKAGGRTPFCDITEGFTVDVIEADTNLDGVIDGNDAVSLQDQFVFTVSCVDNPLTLVNEALYCPLSSIVWDVDEEETTSQAKAQVFVGHTGSASTRTGKITK